MAFQELRVHGVSGTPPRDILYTDPVTYAPPSQPTKVYQAPRGDPCFDPSAFHWANLTSGSRITALWILLAPYALANAAGWMAGWRKDPTKPMAESDDPQPWHAILGRMSIRTSGLALTGLFVSQALIAGVLLPLKWLETNDSIGIIGLEISLGWLDQRLGLTLLVTVVVALFYWIVAHVSTKSHFPEVRPARAARLLFDPSDEVLATTREDDISLAAADSEWEDPAGALITDARLWTVHPMLHRLRRLHFAAGTLVVALGVLAWIGLLPLSVILALFLALIASWGWMITYHTDKGWSRGATSGLPLGAVLVLAGSLLAIWLTSVDEWHPDRLHGMTFGIAAVLGLSAFFSLAAGPLSIGALVLATFFGALLGTTIGLLVDRGLGTDVLVSQGVGWVAVAMLALLVWLVIVAIFLALIGRKNPESGATSPLPSPIKKKVFVMLRRVELEARVLFYAAGVFGLAAFAHVVGAMWSFGFEQRIADGLPTSGLAGIWGTLVAGLDPAALNQFPDSLINWSLTIALLGPGLFAVRSIVKGWKGGEEGEGRRRQVGILWDLGSFWPRWFHPLAPPGYGPRATKDLAGVLEKLPEGSILGAHSQGALISAVTMQQSGHGIGFITYGAQLGILYPRMFPNTGIPNLVDEVIELCPDWINLWRRTDFIGGHFINRTGVDNRLVAEKIGHSGYETTAEYSISRREIAGIGAGPCD